MEHEVRRLEKTGAFSILILYNLPRSNSGYVLLLGCKS